MTGTGDACVRQYRDAFRATGSAAAASVGSAVRPPPLHSPGDDRLHPALHPRHDRARSRSTSTAWPTRIGLAATYWVMSHEARRRGHDPELLGNGLIVVAIAAIIGGRAYHVIDQFAYYKDHLAQAFLPVDAAGNFIGFGGLGVYGGIITGTIAAFIYLRRNRRASGCGPTSSRPACSRCRRSRAGATSSTRSCTGRRRTCPGGSRSSARIGSSSTPARPARTRTRRSATTSSRSSCTSRCPGFLGALALLFLARRFGRRLRTGDLLAAFFIWYGVVALRPRDPAGRQLDVLRGADGPDLLDDLHPARRRDHRDPAPQRGTDAPRGRLGGEGRRARAGRGPRRGWRRRRRLTTWPTRRLRTTWPTPSMTRTLPTTRRPPTAAVGDDGRPTPRTI